MKTVSWVVVQNITRKALFETFNAKVAAAINVDRYTAVPILEYLTNINGKVESCSACGNSLADGYQIRQHGKGSETGYQDEELVCSACLDKELNEAGHNDDCAIGDGKRCDCPAGYEDAMYDAAEDCRE